ncbi:MAG: DMT family transporter [Erysipelotrichaceae bacterium]
MTHTKANFLLVFVAMVWGGGFIATSAALESFSPFYTIMIRFIIAGLILGVMCFDEIYTLNKKEMVFSIFTGIILFGAFAFQTVGLQYTTASKNAFLTATNVVFVPYLIWLIYKNKPKNKTIFASLLCFLGVGALTLNNNGFNFGLGELYSVVCALFFAIHIISLEKGKHIRLKPFTSIQMLTAGVIASIFALSFESAPSDVNMSGWVSMMFLTLISTLLAYLLQTYAQKHTSANEVSMILSCEAIFASIFSFIFLKEILTFKMIIGICMIFTAILIQNWRKGK